MKVVVDNRQRLRRVSRAALVDFAEALAELAGVSLSELCLILVDDAGIAPINEAAVGHAGATDVITLRYPPMPGDDLWSSEVIVNVECAVKQGADDPDREFAFYIAHAFDHLSGHDDATPASRTSMHRREWRWLGKTGIPALLSPTSKKVKNG